MTSDRIFHHHHHPLFALHSLESYCAMRATITRRKIAAGTEALGHCVASECRSLRVDAGKQQDERGDIAIVVEGVRNVRAMM
jgi:hypothetical protein